MATPLQSFWYYLTQLGWKDKVYEVLKPHGVESFRFLSIQKQEEVIDSLRGEWKERSKRPRGTVIHYLCMMPNYNYKTFQDEPDYDKIDTWVKSKMGGKALNQLNLPELNKVVKIVKSWYEKEIKTKPIKA